MVNEHVLDAILKHGDASPIKIREMVREEFGVEVSPVTILRIKGEQEREENIRKAQMSASERLSDKMDLTEELITSYLDLMKDDTLPIKDRLMAMRDLRGWVKLAVESAGSVGASRERIFEISGEWDLGFEPEQVN